MKFINFLVFSFLFSLSLNAQWEKTNASFGGNINVLEVINGNLIAGTDKGVFFSNDNGITWNQKNNGLTNKTVYSIVVNGTDIFIGTGGSGVFLSTDNAETWKPVNKGMSNSDVRSLFYKGSNIFAGTEMDGVFISSDNGKNWQSINSGLTNSPFRTIIEYAGSIYVGTNGSGLFRTFNNGLQWTKTNVLNKNDPNSDKINALAVIDTKLFVGTEGGLYTTTSYSNIQITWSPPTSGFPVNSLKVKGSNIYVGTRAEGYDYNLNDINQHSIWRNMSKNMYVQKGNYGVLFSSNNGITWSYINKGLSNKPVNAITVIGSNLFAGTLGTGVYFSDNNGVSWKLRNKGIGSSKIVSIVNLSGTVYAGTDGAGVHKSSDGGITWEECNNGLPIMKITSLASSGSILFAGTFGAGLYKSIDGGNSWKFCPFSKNIICDSDTWGLPDISYSNSVFYIGDIHITANGKIYISVSGWSSGTCFSNNIKIGMNPGIYSSSDYGDTWVNNTQLGDGSKFASSESYVYTNSIMSANNGFSWSKYPYFTNAGISSIEAIDSIVVIGTNYDGFYKSNDYGSTFYSNKYINDFIFVGKSINVLAKTTSSMYAGTDYGVYYSSNFFDKAVKVNKGLLDTNVSTLMILGSDIYIGTFNGTIWKRKIQDIVQLPSAAGIISGFASICKGQKNVVYNVPPINNTNFYIWQLPNGKIDTTSTNTISIDFSESDVSGNLSVFGLNDFGRGLDSVLFIKINDLPNVTLTNFESVCKNSGIISLNGGLPTGGKYSGLSVNNNSFNSSINSGSYPITYTYTDINGCTSSAIKNLIVNQTPLVVITSSVNPTVCKDTKLELSTTTKGSSYSWSSGETVSNIYPTQSGVYSLKLKDINGCEGISNSIKVTINLLPEVKVTINGPTTYCTTKLTELVASNGVSYLWNDGSTTKTIKPTQSGSYFVKLTDINGCSASSEPVYLTVNDCASLDNLSDKNVLLYPNPITDILTVELPAEYVNAKFKVIDVSGKELVNGNLNTTMNTINLESLASGTYFLEIGNEYRTKFIKQ